MKSNKYTLKASLYYPVSSRQTGLYDQILPHERTEMGRGTNKFLAKARKTSIWKHLKKSKWNLDPKAGDTHIRMYMQWRQSRQEG